MEINRPQGDQLPRLVDGRQELVRNRLLESLAKATKAEKALGSYMLGELSDLPFQTAAEIAKKLAWVN